MIARLLAVVFALCLSGTAGAEVVWSTPGSGCIPDETTLKFNRHAVGNASVQHAAGNVDLIGLTCPVAPFTSSITDWSLALTYVDSTGDTPVAALVRARLYQMGLESATPVLLATVNSNSSRDTGVNFIGSPIFTHTFNFDANVYWVHVELERAATNETVIFHSVALQAITISDIRAKHDIVLLGHLDNGLGFYRFSYHGSDAAFVGVMAQEVEAIMPDAVARGSDGYLRVFYDRLGLRMQTWEEWVAGGEKNPADRLLDETMSRVWIWTL